jgi:hypothetical protein
VRTGHVGPELLELGDDLGHVLVAQRCAVAGHVLVDRGPAHLDRTVVQVEEAALDLDLAQPHPATDDLLDAPAVAEGHPRRVEDRVLGRPQLRARDPDAEVDAPAVGALGRQLEGLAREPPHGRAELDRDRRPQPPAAPPLEHAV